MPSLTLSTLTHVFLNVCALLTSSPAQTQQCIDQCVIDLNTNVTPPVIVADCWSVLGVPLSYSSSSSSTGVALSSTNTNTLTSSSSSTTTTYNTTVPTLAVTPLVWLAANTLPSSGVGSALSSWSDSSGHSNGFTQATMASQPTLQYSSSQTPNEPWVLFSGAQSMTGAGVFPTSADYSLMVVLSYPRCNTANADCVFLGSAGLGHAFYLHQGNLTLLHGGVLFTGATPSVPVNTIVLLEVVYSYSSSIAYFYINGVAQGNVTAATPTTDETITLGWWNSNTGTSFTGNIYEVMVFNSALSASNRQSIESYLKNKYSL